MENKLRRYILHLSSFAEHSRCKVLDAFVSSNAGWTGTKHDSDKSLVKAWNIYACYTALNCVAHSPNVSYTALFLEMVHGLQGFSLADIFFLQFRDTDL